jgi:hypothetical protein
MRDVEHDVVLPDVRVGLHFVHPRGDVPDVERREAPYRLDRVRVDLDRGRRVERPVELPTARPAVVVFDVQDVLHP